MIFNSRVDNTIVQFRGSILIYVKASDYRHENEYVNIPIHINIFTSPYIIHVIALTETLYIHHRVSYLSQICRGFFFRVSSLMQGNANAFVVCFFSGNFWADLNKYKIYVTLIYIESIIEIDLTITTNSLMINDLGTYVCICI